MSDIRPLRNDEEIEKFIKEKYGTYQNYRAQQQPVRKNAELKKRLADCLVGCAKAEGVTLEKYLERHPEEYRRWLELA